MLSNITLQRVVYWTTMWIIREVRISEGQIIRAVLYCKCPKRGALRVDLISGVRFIYKVTKHLFDPTSVTFDYIDMGVHLLSCTIQTSLEGMSLYWAFTMHGYAVLIFQFATLREMLVRYESRTSRNSRRMHFVTCKPQINCIVYNFVRLF